VIETKRLLNDLQKLARKLEDDMRQRCADHRDIDDRVRGEYAKAKGAGRTSQAYETWRDEFITQATVAWILGCVFVRFLEDNQLIESPRLAGPGERLTRARDAHTLYFREQPTHSDREYLEHVFREVERLPAMKALFDERHNPLWTLAPTGDGATMLLSFWQQVDPTSGALVHDFTDAEWNTRFLGDLYQDLSEAARKKYALLQTPIFVEEFILDRTLKPAIDEFGYQTIRMIDPACGSGHFLLGAFHRLFDLRVKNEPGANPRMLAQQALASVHGVDLNPYAIAIARFRLLLAALKASDINRLEDAPDFKINLAVGDSLLHGEHQEQLRMGWHPIAHVYETEDRDELNRILKRGHYHAVVGNPPYITVKDAALNKAYRQYGSCHMKYSLAVPFMERFFDLAIQGNGDGRTLAGYVGMITANSFMKREFGKKLIESYIPRWELTHVIDTSGAYIPGHGTPTVILFGRNRRPVADTIRTVMGIRGEPSTPEDAAQGQVWTAIINQVDVASSQSDFVSVADTPRSSFHKHPWSIGGGGAAELKELLDEQAERVLEKQIESIGVGIVTLEDEAFAAPQEVFNRNQIEPYYLRSFVDGDAIRDWSLQTDVAGLFPYSPQNLRPETSPSVKKYLWSLKTGLRNRVWFRKSQDERNLAWFEYGYLSTDKAHASLLITYAEVATHNHFVLDRGGKVFKQTAPVIKLPAGASEDEHLALLGLLNSSTACFWMKQVFQNKGSTVDEHGARQRTMPFEDFYQHSGTGLKNFPVTKTKPLALARALAKFAQQLQALLPATLAEYATPNRAEWQQAEQQATRIRSEMIALQEELDWQCYKLYGLIANDLTLPIEQVPSVQLGERAFEIVMARRLAAGELETTWFERHGSTPITDIPAHWPAAYRKLVERRIALIESDRNISLIEQPEYKRRWNSEPWAAQQERALREWMLNRLEDARYWTEMQLTSCARLADLVRQDSEFMQVAEFYRGREDFDLMSLITELVRSEAVPFLPVLRYKESGLRNREQWERTWELQRQEDAIDARTRLPEGDPQRLTVEQAAQLKREQIGDIPVPPKYKPSDFQDAVYWRLRGKLDVPKERFISYPHCQRAADPTMVIAWAGWDHLQQAQALAAYYELARTNEGWSQERLMPLLAGLLELIPWLLQWHNELDEAHNLRMGDFFEGFVTEEARSMSMTLDEIRAWRPQATARRR